MGAFLVGRYNPFQNFIPDFMKKKKDTTPVPVSSQRSDQQTLPAATTQTSTESSAVTPTATTEAVVDASEDIFSRVEKLEEDLGLGVKRRKAKEVRRSTSFLFTISFCGLGLHLASPSRAAFPLHRLLLTASLPRFHPALPLFQSH